MTCVSCFDSLLSLPYPDETLLVLDIDETVLYFPFYQPNQIEYDSISELEHWSTHISCFKPIATDLKGLRSCLNRFKSCCFLTARNKELQNLTLQHLQDIGLKDVDKLIIHFTNGTSKGKHLSEWMKKLHKFKQIVFVDDQLINLKDVEETIKTIPVKSYLFSRFA